MVRRAWGPEDVQVRPPGRADLPACRLILPEVFIPGAPRSLVAVAPDPMRFLGVVATRPTPSTHGAAWTLDLHVVGPYRRRGIGRRLLNAIIAEARQRNITYLAAASDPDSECARAFLEAGGFERVLRLETFEGELDRHAAEVADLYERLRRRGRIPDNVRIVRLEEAPREPLLRLLAAPSGNLDAGNPGLPDLSWSEAWRHPSVSRVSPVVMVGDDPVAVVLAERRGDIATVAWRTVSPEYRLGWANILLGHTAISWMRESGTRKMRFISTSLTTDTERMSRIFGARLISRRDHYRLTLDTTGTP